MTDAPQHHTLHKVTHDSAYRYCIVIPHYCHVQQLAAFLPQLENACLPVMVVDDGSDAETLTTLRALVAAHSWACLHERGTNGGKGAAMISGMEVALERQFTHVISLDADGQHNPDDVARLHQASKLAPNAVFSGRPVFGEDIPKSRLYGRMITNTLTKVETFSGTIKDAMCGLRLYPVRLVLPLCYQMGRRVRMELDTEVLVRACWRNIDVRFIDTKVIYPDSGRSHFRMLHDNARLTVMHITLLISGVLRLPQRLWRSLGTAAESATSNQPGPGRRP